MAVITKFCFSCSVRLGSIITGCLTLIQACVLLGVTLNTPLDKISDSLNQWLSEIRLEEGCFNEIANNPKLILTISSVFFSCLICSSVLLIYGSFQTRPLLMYPFIVFYFLYILALFFVLLFVLEFIKVKGNGLGQLILYSNLGGFTLLLYLYTWCSVVSLTQIVNELQVRLKHKLRVVDAMKKKKNVYNYAHFN
ncbi:uncharacterized protein LOC123003809 [Tribolium madens]|uniref:uncharacterized protein LOC123003809 n=1 Tax=Tribolium madens TaxID=41895 RepID=UPI001CF73287|nr:uncharacterized protein LOC123003809 [Tribolium madens]